MTTTIKELMHALATLLGATSYNDYLEARQPIPVPVKPVQQRLPTRNEYH